MKTNKALFHLETGLYNFIFANFFCPAALLLASSVASHSSSFGNSIEHFRKVLYYYTFLKARAVRSSFPLGEARRGFHNSSQTLPPSLPLPT